MAQLPQLTNVSWQAYAMIAAGLAIIYLLPRVTKAVPSPLVAILGLTAVSIATGAPVNTVGDMGDIPQGLPSLVWPDVPLTLDASDHPALFAGHGGRGPAGVAADRADRR